MFSIERLALFTGAGLLLAFIGAGLLRKKTTWPQYIAYAGFMLAASSLLVRFFDTGRAPWATLYETAAILGMVAALASGLSFRAKYPAALYVPLGCLSAALLVLSGVMWDDAGMVSDALQSPWLIIHVPVVILSYGSFAISAAAATGIIALKVMGKDSKDYGRLDRLSCNSIIAGMALLIPGIVMGAIWANAAWGSYWSWDPKETWALITAVVYAIYLVARKTGMKGENAAYVSLLGFVSVIFTYIGVSYLIPGLHSYA